jgi:AcrR family transcriptional regulator
MGNREALLAGAKRCLLEKGFGRTTARDIAAASGVSLAAIGYHFGSKEALLIDALMAAIQEWEAEFRETLSGSARPNATPMQRFESIWGCLIESFTAHRSLWAANFDVFSQMDHVPEIRRGVGKALKNAWAALASLFLNVDEAAIDGETVRTVGAFHHGLMIGVMAQWLMDPKQAPSARDLTEAVRRLTAEPRGGTKARKEKQRAGSRRKAGLAKD